MLKQLLFPLAICSILCLLIACGEKPPPNVPPQVFQGAKQILVEDSFGPATVGVPFLIPSPIQNDTAHDYCELRLDGIQLDETTFGTLTEDNGAYTFTPNPGTVGKTCKITYQASSTIMLPQPPSTAVVETGFQTISIEIMGPSNPARANPDSYLDRRLPAVEKYYVPQGLQVSLPVMLNDDNIDGATITNVSTPSNGGFASTVNEQQGFIGFSSSTSGDSEFDYTITKNGQSSSAHVTVRVLPQARAFIINNSDSELTIKANFDESMTVQPRFNGADGSFPGRGILVFSVLPGGTTFRAEAKNPTITENGREVTYTTSVNENGILVLKFDQEPTPHLGPADGNSGPNR